MPHHFTKNTVEATFWCAKCHRETLHTVHDGRRGSCLICRANPTVKKPPQPVVPEQPKLF
jgi:hypothetical protein